MYGRVPWVYGSVSLDSVTKRDSTLQTNACSYIRVTQQTVKTSFWPAALGLCRPGAATVGLVQPCPKPRAVFHKHFLGRIHEKVSVLFHSVLLEP